MIASCSPRPCLTWRSTAFQRCCRRRRRTSARRCRHQGRTPALPARSSRSPARLRPIPLRVVLPASIDLVIVAPSSIHGALSSRVIAHHVIPYARWARTSSFPWMFSAPSTKSRPAFWPGPRSQTAKLAPFCHGAGTASKYHKALQAAQLQAHWFFGHRTMLSSNGKVRGRDCRR